MHVDNSKQLPTVISFCSDMVEIERGLELKSIEHRVLAYVEIETFAIANLVAKMEQGDLVPAPIWTNLKTFPAHLEIQLTSSLEDIRANRLAWQEERKPLTIPDTSSPTSSTMCEQLEFSVLLRGMSKDTSTGDSNQSSKTWKAQVTIQRGEYSQRKKLAHLTKGNASSFLPTPTATPYGNNQGEQQEYRTSETLSGINGETRSVANPDSRQLQSQGSESEQWGWTGNSGQEGSMADPNSNGEIRNQPKDWEGAWTEQGREELANPRQFTTTQCT